MKLKSWAPKNCFSAVLISSMTLFFVAAAVVPREAAAAPHRQKMAKPIPILRGEGALRGGVASVNLGILDIRRTALAKNQKDRIVMDLGAVQPKVTKPVTAYYHVELSKSPQRLVVDLPQVLGSRFPDSQLEKRLLGSSLIKQGYLNFDRVNQTTQLVLELKKPAAVSIFQVPKKGNPAVSQLVLDVSALRPQKSVLPQGAKNKDVLPRRAKQKATE